MLRGLALPGEVVIDLRCCRQLVDSPLPGTAPLSLTAQGAWMRCLGYAAQRGGIMAGALDWDDKRWRHHVGIGYQHAMALLKCGYLLPDGGRDVRVLTGTAARYL